MKSKSCILMLTLFILTLSHSMTFSQTKDIKQLPVEISILGTRYDNALLKYPLLLIDGDIYYPLSWELSQALGFVPNYTSSTGLSLTRKTNTALYELTSRNFGASLIQTQARNVTYPLTLNGSPLKSNKPFYNISNITYISLNDTPSLNINALYTMDDGFVLTSSKTATLLPKSYSTYDVLDSDKLIRNQGTDSTCWAFASNTLFEISIAKKTGVYNDFSEDHLIMNTPIPSNYESGGNYLASSVYYQNALGPVDESLAPIGSYSKNKTFSVDYTLLDYTELSNDLPKTKRLIYEYGAVLTSLYFNEADPVIYNATPAAYYNSKDSNPRTHELVLIGWDDSYSNENFIIKPKSNGAFIAQNSFGSRFGENGFFYISYEDVHILDQVYSITNFEIQRTNAKPYYYDTTGLTHYESFDDKNNAFGINNFKNSEPERLKRVSFYTAENNMSISLTYEAGKYNGSIQMQPKLNLLVKDKGFHTVDLPIELKLNSDEGFWVAVNYIGTSPFVIPIEAPYPGINYYVTANKGEGIIGNGTLFQDLTSIRNRASIAIRAVTFK